MTEVKSQATLPAENIQTFFDKENVQEKFAKVLGDNATSYITSILSVVNSNTNLQKAKASTIYTAAMTAAALGLPINQNMGFAYIIPYGTSAQFQMGYKGYQQLAVRSGQYRTIYAKPIYEGQYVEDDSFVGFHFDWKAKKSDNIVGYASYFELKDGFSDVFYMDRKEVEKHGRKYSKSYGGQRTENFDKMALKTVIKLHLNSGKAPLSIEMQTAITRDQAVMDDMDNLDQVKYPDNPTNNIQEAEVVVNEDYAQQWVDDLNRCKTIEEVEQLRKDNKVTDKTILSLIDARKNELKK